MSKLSDADFIELLRKKIRDHEEFLETLMTQRTYRDPKYMDDLIKAEVSAIDRYQASIELIERHSTRLS